MSASDAPGECSQFITIWRAAPGDRASPSVGRAAAAHSGRAADNRSLPVVDNPDPRRRARAPGISLGAVTGEAVAMIAAGDAPAFDPAPVLPGRFG